MKASGILESLVQPSVAKAKKILVGWDGELDQRLFCFEQMSRVGVGVDTQWICDARKLDKSGGENALIKLWNVELVYSNT